MARVPHPTKTHIALNYKEPLSVRLGRYAVYSGASFAVLAILYSLAWFGTSMLLRAGVQDWFAARNAQGYVAKYDDKKARITGFPFALNIRLKDVVFAPPLDPSGKRGWNWQIASLDLSTLPLPWTLRTLNVDMSAPQSLSMNAQTYRGQAERFQLTFDWMSKGVPEDIALDIAQWNLHGEQHSLKLDRVQLDAQRQSSGDYQFELKGQDVDLPNAVIGMGKKLSQVLARGRFTHNFATQKWSKSAIEEWRDRGGTLEFERLLIDYVPLSLQGNGTLALDGDLQIVGAFSARIQGFFETVERLRRARVIRGPDASMAKVVLGMLAKYPGNGGPATISVALTLQERALFVGPVRLIEIPQLKW